MAINVRGTMLLSYACRPRTALSPAPATASRTSTARPYGSDLRLLTGLAAIPAVQCGPGDAALAHGPHESVAEADVAVTARTLALFALDRYGR